MRCWKELLDQVQKAFEASTMHVPRSFRRVATMQADDGLHEDLLHHMLGIYTFRLINAQTMLSLPQIVRGIACCCSKWLCRRWTEDALILSWSQIERPDLAALFANVNVIITVLHDSP